MGVQREMERKGGDAGEGMSIEGGKGWGLKGRARRGGARRVFRCGGFWTKSYWESPFP